MEVAMTVRFTTPWRGRLSAGVCAVLAAVAAASGCGSEAAVAAGPCGNPDPTTAEGWIAYAAAHPSDVALVVDDGLGGRFSSGGERAQPLASAAKTLHLAAYARAVALGEASPEETVRVGDWEKWYLPGTDGGAHPAALERLGVSGPDDVVALDQLVSAMIQESDNAAADYLRARLGDDALRAAGWEGELPAFLGAFLALDYPELKADLWGAAQAYAENPGFTASLRKEPADSYEAQAAAVAPITPNASAEWLSALHRSLADGSFGPGAEIARGHLEWQDPPAGYEGLGFKGGALAGVLAEAMTLRRADGTIASSVLLARAMSADEWQAAFSSFAHQGLMVELMAEEGALGKLECLG
jgi:hypothetical protein